MVVCSIEVAGIRNRSVSATTAHEAIRQALLGLATTLTTPDGQNLPVQMNTMSPNDASASSERSLSKARQQTFGVTMPLTLKDHLSSLANEESTSFADVSRRYAVFGFEDFVDRTLYTSSSSMFEQLTNELHSWNDSESEQVMLRFDPGHAVRIRSAAKEHRKSVSELTALCLAHGLVMQELLVTLQPKVAKYRGASIRSLVTELSLPSFATPLISGVLVGNIRAPRTLLKRLASVFDAPESLLSTLFRGSFDRRLVPSFKAESGKPMLAVAPTSWSSAVKSLNLSKEDVKALLDLGV